MERGEETEEKRGKKNEVERRRGEVTREWGKRRR